MKNVNFYEQDLCSEYLFKSHEPFWHLYTNGNLSGIIFTCDEEFIYGMNLMAICLAGFPSLKIFTFELMNNHMHVLFSGSEVDVRLFFDAYKKRLARYMNKRERVINWQNFTCELKKIEDYNAIRNEIAYINRNGYVVSPQFTPFSYPWGANCAFFNSSIYDILKEPFNQIPYRKRRDIFQLRESLPDSYMVSNNLILPSSYCKIKDAEQLFRNAHQYYSIVSKNWEAYRDLAKEFGDTCFLTDNEMYAAISSLCKKEYGQGRPNLLSIEQKGEVARKMKYDYGASTKQIRSILRLESGLLNSLFPKL